MFPCLFGLLAVATIVALRAAWFAGFAHLLEERGDRRVGLAGDVLGDLDRLALGGGGGFAPAGKTERQQKVEAVIRKAVAGVRAE